MFLSHFIGQKSYTAWCNCYYIRYQRLSRCSNRGKMSIKSYFLEFAYLEFDYFYQTDSFMHKQHLFKLLSLRQPWQTISEGVFNFKIYLFPADKLGFLIELTDTTQKILAALWLSKPLLLTNKFSPWYLILKVPFEIKESNKDSIKKTTFFYS